MKTKIIAAIALCGSSLSPLLSVPAFAATPTAATDTAMDTQCAADLLAAGAGDPDFVVETVVGNDTAAAPVEVAGSGVQENWAPAGYIVSVSGVSAAGSTALTRNGKSPNIFVTDAKASSVTWSNSTYDYTANYTVTTTFQYECKITETVHHHDLVTPAVPGHHVWAGPAGANPNQGACDAYDAAGNFQGENQGQCDWVDGTPAVYNDYDTETVTNVAHSIDEVGDPYSDTTEGLSGGQHTFYDQNEPVAAVVCISPGKVPGTWRAQNGYDGTGVKACSTTLFNSLPGGTIPSASLPSVI